MARAAMFGHFFISYSRLDGQADLRRQHQLVEEAAKQLRSEFQHVDWAADAASLMDFVMGDEAVWWKDRVKKLVPDESVPTVSLLEQPPPRTTLKDDVSSVRSDMELLVEDMPSIRSTRHHVAHALSASAIAWAIAAALTVGALVARRRRLDRNRHSPAVVAITRFGESRPPRLRDYAGTATGLVLLSSASWAAALSMSPDAVSFRFATRVLLLLPVVVATAPGNFLWRRYRGRLDGDVAKTVALDGRAPVLLLRPFSDDGTLSAIDPPRQPGFHIFTSHEEELIAVLRAVGPVVAVGRPDQSTPPAGAARLYVQGEDWQAAVRGLMATSALVVLRLGPGQGVAWEVDEALSRFPRERLVLLLPAMANLAAMLCGYVSDEVVAQASEAERAANGWVSAVITFDSNGTPIITPVKDATQFAVGFRERFGVSSRHGLRFLAIAAGILPVLMALVLGLHLLWLIQV